MSINGGSQVVSITGTVSTTPKSLADFGFTADQVAAADRAFISVGANALRVAWDHPSANPPTTSAGLLLPTNNYPIFEIVGRANVAALKMIRDGSSDATVSITIEQN